MRVASIKALGRQDVYNMEVETTHDFAVNNGVIVHNCYDMTRYVMMANPIAPKEEVAEPVFFGDDPLNMHQQKKRNFYDM